MGEQRSRRAAAGALSRGLVLARRRVAPAPNDRSRDCPQKQSSPYIRRVQHTVLSVAGLKGTMSEAELHLLRARLACGALNKAKRGELQVYLPIGLAYDAVGRVVLDPDEQVRQSVQLVFATFQRTGSAFAVVREFRRQSWLFPRHQRSGPGHEQVMWKQLSYPLVTKILHNPRYAGAFVYGRTTARKSADGRRGAVRRLPVEQCPVLIKDAHPGYLSWEQYEANLARLRENTARPSTNDRRSAPREGPALLQGLIMCGICGQRMHPRYTARSQHLWPYYLCPRQDLDDGRLSCQHISPERQLTMRWASCCLLASAQWR